MDVAYAVTPFAAWLVAGSTKFAVNTALTGRGAMKLVGYGGFPSNHSAIVSSMATLVALREGVDSAAFGVALTLAFIVTMDAASLRRQIGLHAEAINSLRVPDAEKLRERIGHTPAEIAGGITVGALVAWGVARLLPAG